MEVGGDVGSVQILRFRCSNTHIVPIVWHGIDPELSFIPRTEEHRSKRKKGGDRLHLHVDRDARVGPVFLLSLGATVR